MRNFDRSLPMALMRTREAVMNRFRPILQKHGVTEQQWRVLRVLMEYNGLETTELADRSNIMMPSLSRILKLLIAEGWVSRSTVATDQRRFVITITSRGRSLVSKIAPHSEAIYRDIEKAIGVNEIEELYRLLNQATEKLKV